MLSALHSGLNARPSVSSAVSDQSAHIVFCHEDALTKSTRFQLFELHAYYLSHHPLHMISRSKTSSRCPYHLLHLLTSTSQLIRVASAHRSLCYVHWSIEHSQTQCTIFITTRTLGSGFIGILEDLQCYTICHVRTPVGGTRGTTIGFGDANSLS